MLIEAKNISVQYGHQVVLNNLTFHINKGDYLNIIGPNGSGKTTLIKLLTGLQKPTSGEITHASVVFGYLPQHLRDANKLPVTVYEVLRHSNLKKSSEQEIDSLLSMMSIEKLKHQKMSKLSGGEQQRVYIIRALLSKPECLILDEPTSALDPKFRKSFYDYIEKLNDEGLTIIHVTHDLSDGLRHGSKILELDQSLKFFGTFEQYQLQEHRKGAHIHHV